MAFKNIEHSAQQNYEGYQFIDEDDKVYAATFMDRFGITDITRGHGLGFTLYTKDIPQLIKVLQSVYEQSNLQGETNG